MSKSISIKFQWSKELAIKASKLYYNYDMKHSSKRYVGWLFVAFVQFGIVGALKHDSFGLLYLSTFLVIYWYYGRWYLRKLMIEKYYDKLNVTTQDMIFTLKNGKFYNKDQEISWSDILKVIEFDDGILLQTNTNTLFFEKDAFDSKNSLKAFLKCMKEKGKI